MEKLELKHLAPYLPYGLKVKYKSIGNILPMTSLHTNGVGIGWNRTIIEMVKPILKPLSDLIKELDGIKYYVLAELMLTPDQDEWILGCVENNLEFNSFRIGGLDKLFEHHFDVFGLIEKGLAIDINTLDK